MERILGFAQKFDQAHFDLACHAAFPQTLTPDLLYQIWLRFVPQAPWTAVARILLSRLCREVGYELYEMDVAVRNLLLIELKEDERFGKQQLDKLAEFYTNYLNQQFGKEEAQEEYLTQPQYWIALGSTKSKHLSRKLAEAIESRLKQKNWKELFRLASFIEAVPEALVEFPQSLVIYALGIEKLTTGDPKGAVEQFNRLPRQKQYIQIDGVNVPILDQVSLSPFRWGNSSLTLYAFHLRNSINQGEEPTVAEAPQLWEQLVDLGNKLHIAELQTLQQQLICYQENQYFPQAEDSLGVEYSNLLRNQEPSLNFRLITQTGGLELQGLLCPFRLHDSYAIDLTLYSQDNLSLQELRYLNPQNLLLPPQIQASLGQTLLLFTQPIEPQEDYQNLADACVNQILSERNSTEFVGTGYLLGNPIFEYESDHTDPAQKLHILVWFKCQDMNQNHMDKVSEILLYLLWFRHTIQYVYHQSRWCDARAKELYDKLPDYERRFHQITQAANRLEIINKGNRLGQLLAEIRQMELEYVRYLGELADHKNTIATNEHNYRTKLEKLESLPETNLGLWQEFLHHIHDKLQQQIQSDLSFLEQRRDYLQQVKATFQKAIVSERVKESKDMIENTVTENSPANKYQPSITPERYIRLRNALLNCDQFRSYERLQNFLGAYDVLRPWHDFLPEAHSRSELVDIAIDYLHNQFRRDTKENALVILLHLLAELIDPADSCRQTLVELAQELESSLR
ncbi:hypothetical protein [Sphaerospermopsis aphanizomenoides]|uniref:hypothetical protein n=1 Tax=Sphaerospermopsis aphanizomenoides TaxID=459663 RepID=UPI0019036CE3|nr:hypothetical protein [Sphaerospermopsis aphanizomenoides]